MNFLREVARFAVIGGVIGLPVLGVCGRAIMRIIAHWEGRVPEFTWSGSLTVVFVGTLGGLAAGIVYGALTQFVRSPIIRNTGFVAACAVFAWYAEINLLLRPRLMFVGLIVVYAIVLELIASMIARHPTPTRGSANTSQAA